MKILFISQYFYPEQFLNNALCKELAKKGHDIEVVSCVPNYPEGRFFDGYSNRKKRKERWSGLRIRRAFTIPRGNSSFQLIANYCLYPFAAFLEIMKLPKPRADVSFVSMPSPLLQAIAGIFAKWFYGIPMVYWVQDIWPESAIITLNIRNKAIKRIMALICGWIYRRADHVMVQSPAFVEKVASFGVPADRISVLPNFAPDMFVPIDETSVSSEVRKLVPSNKFNLMFAGNIGESQNFPLLLDAAERLASDDHIRWIILGSGRGEKWLTQEIKRRKLDKSFILLGRFPEAQMPQFFARADAMLVSLKDNPIFALTVPSKVQCYMACGKPIIASIKGEGARVVEQSGGGVTVSPNNAKELADKIRELSQCDPADLTAMGNRSREYYNRHFEKDMVSDILEKKLSEFLKPGSRLST
ncbi:glycosyltransferase family 4 protein [Sphingorhabdus sp. M41]|uniref:glycosyltransferase family 4 protein n=1 Tax=Sphingorhabdus sp. M41 TaxID=1806885 RepID=UPI00078B9EC7|nr:glycosyltransferase family 4 protein [Sphingorhabdus sp. M41]AMO73039.1 hypothetical protein AZE99_15330 [Sphingorhabdus sp. M41]